MRSPKRYLSVLKITEAQNKQTKKTNSCCCSPFVTLQKKIPPQEGRVLPKKQIENAVLLCMMGNVIRKDLIYISDNECLQTFHNSYFYNPVTAAFHISLEV
jgi:hypothetical protein